MSSAFYFKALVSLLLLGFTLAAVPHSHKSPKTNGHTGHEREADGAYSPKDHGHSSGNLEYFKFYMLTLLCLIQGEALINGEGGLIFSLITWGGWILFPFIT